jgi:hypothetical protein
MFDQMSDYYLLKKILLYVIGYFRGRPNKGRAYLFSGSSCYQTDNGLWPGNQSYHTGPMTQPLVSHHSSSSNTFKLLTLSESNNVLKFSCVTIRFGNLLFTIIRVDLGTRPQGTGMCVCVCVCVRARARVTVY